MLAKYRRHARHAAELGLGWLAPLNDALPELAGVCSEVCNDEASDNPPAARTSGKDSGKLGTPGRIRTYDQWIRNLDGSQGVAFI